MNIEKKKKIRKLRRKAHIKKIISGTSERPRLTVTRTLNHVYAQLINDETGKTILSASSLDKDLKPTLAADLKKMDLSKEVGRAIAKKALQANIKKVSFDRNGFLYHGRIKAIADAAREAGLEF